ncbi:MULTISPECIES: hypothetical protein [Burkholderia cepacia complex]|uniref:Uncharacterized protein n=1 Tax=Burkholderia pyrrocinia TaxID=60550 RepID=A0ABZ3BQU1_BURPY|nr:hypothetical protein [Burkholderia stabilis]
MGWADCHPLGNRRDYRDAHERLIGHGHSDRECVAYDTDATPSCRLSSRRITSITATAILRISGPPIAIEIYAGVHCATDHIIAAPQTDRAAFIDAVVGDCLRMLGVGA